MLTLPSQAPLNGVIGREAFTQFLSATFKQGDPIWLKTGHSDFYIGTVTHDGEFPVILTSGRGT